MKAQRKTRKTMRAGSVEVVIGRPQLGFTGKQVEEMQMAATGHEWLELLSEATGKDVFHK